MNINRLDPDFRAELAWKLFMKHRAIREHNSQQDHPFTHYTGILTLQCMARFAVTRKDDALLDALRETLVPFIRGECTRFWASFKNYFCGGNATAYLHRRGHLPGADEAIRHYGEELMQEAPRSKEGVFSYKWRDDKEGIWIDAAFAVVPFLLNAGLALDEPEWIDEACHQVLAMFDILRDPDNGLLHQSRGLVGPGLITGDHWSRGNGWGVLAAAELVEGLPGDHPRRPAVESAFTDLMQACLRYRTEEGLWCQEMTMPKSYVETSGSGLILFGLSVGLQKGLLGDDARAAFEKGARAFFCYVTENADVFHTCRGCNSPGNGRVEDYLQVGPVRNDGHAFGPAILVLDQMERQAQWLSPPKEEN